MQLNFYGISAKQKVVHMSPVFKTSIKTVQIIIFSSASNLVNIV